MMKLEAPAALKLDHDEMRAELDKALKEPGPIGEAAQDLVRIVLPHIGREEKIAFPPLGLLPELISGDIKPEMASVLPLISQFSAGLNAFHADHERIDSALKALLEAARKESSGEYTQFAYRAMVHERIEEAVIYPTVLLIGEYIREKLKRHR